MSIDDDKNRDGSRTFGKCRVCGDCVHNRRRRWSTGRTCGHYQWCVLHRRRANGACHESEFQGFVMTASEITSEITLRDREGTIRVVTGEMSTVFSTHRSAAEQIAMLQQEVLRLRSQLWPVGDGLLTYHEIRTRLVKALTVADRLKAENERLKANQK